MSRKELSGLVDDFDMRKNNPLKPHRQYWRLRPDIRLARVDHYEAIIKKYLRKSYKGRLQEKWEDLEALYKALFKKDSLKRPLYHPSLKNLKYMSKRTLAVLFFACSHDLRFTEAKRTDSYWRQCHKALEELKAGKDNKENRRKAFEYHQMLKRAGKVALDIYFSKKDIREISQRAPKKNS